jgi:hypothetical protein
MSSKMKQIRKSKRYKNFPIPSTRKSKITFPEVESSALHKYQSYPMPDFLWSKFISVYEESRTFRVDNPTCFEVLPVTAEELSLFPTGLSNDDLRNYLFTSLRSKRKLNARWDYKERTINSEPTSGASMFNPIMDYAIKDKDKLSLPTLFTKDGIQALNQVSHFLFSYVHSE